MAELETELTPPRLQRSERHSLHSTTGFWSAGWKRARGYRGGIIIPDTAKEKPQEGEVISVGKGKSNDEGKVFPLDVKAGDRVLFGKYSGTEIKIDGEEFLIMREEEVLGIVKK